MITKYLVILLGCLLLLVPTIRVSGQFTPAAVEISDVKEVVEGKTFYHHTVKENQTLFGIARKYGVTTATIIEANPTLPEISKGVNIGQIIRIPVSGFSTSHSNEPPTVMAAPAIEASKQISTPTNIIEKSSKETSINGNDYYIHTVEQGQTLYGIGRAYRVTTIKIAESNPNHPELLKGINVGQELLIPKVGTASPPTPPITKSTPWPVGLMKDPRDKTSQFDCSTRAKKPQYNVALLIPLFLDRFDESTTGMRRDHASFTFLPYYQGVLIALDSISQKGADIILHTFDLGRETNQAVEILEKPVMESMDLIIGPFYQETLNLIVSFAKRKGISVVSPLLPGNQQLSNNSNLFQAVPSTQNQLVKLAGFLRSKYSGQNLILVHNNVSEVIPLISDFKRAINTKQVDVNSGGYFMNGSFVGAMRTGSLIPNQPVGSMAANGNSLKEVVLGQGGSVAQIIRLLQPNKKNIIVTLVGNEVMVSNMMQELNSLSANNPASTGTFDIMLIGPSRWEEFQTIDLKVYESLNVHILSTDFVDMHKISNRDYSRRFRSVFLERPNSYAFWGAQTAYMFFDLLVKYGSDFAICLEKSLETNTPLVPFERFGSNENGWINSNLILYRFNNLEKTCALRK